MLRVGIIEDEFLARESLRVFLEQHCTGVKVLFMAADMDEGLSAIRTHRPDALFLDIEMPGHSGMEIHTLLGTTKSPLLVFTTAYANHAVDAFGLDAVDYLLKPIDIVKLRRAVARLSECMAQPTPLHEDRLAVPTSNGQIYIDTQLIDHLAADGSYTEIHLTDGKRHVVSRKLKDLEEHLNSSRFMRIHRSYLVNLSHVEAFIRESNSSVRMRSGALLPVARNSKDALREALGG
jgi:two-component system LytT family response regulator